MKPFSVGRCLAVMVGVLTLSTAASARIPQPALQPLPLVECSEPEGPAGYRDMVARFQPPAVGTHVLQARSYRDFTLRKSPETPRPMQVTQIVLRCGLPYRG